MDTRSSAAELKESAGPKVTAFVMAMELSAADDLEEAEALACRVLDLRTAAMEKRSMAKMVLRLAAIDVPTAEAVLDSELGDMSYSGHVGDGF